MKPDKKGWWMWPPLVIFRYWSVQGAMYMNWCERLHRWFIEFILFTAFYCSGLFVPGLEAALVSFVLAHTASMLLNGHLFAMLTHDLYWYGAYKQKDKFIYYVDEMHARLCRKKPEYVRAVIFYGSLTRGVFRETSDLDVRFVAQPGVWNAIKTAHLVFVERYHALWAKFPIDTYMFMNRPEVERKMDVINERPVSVYSAHNAHEIAENIVEYPQFRQEFMNSETRSE